MRNLQHKVYPITHIGPAIMTVFTTNLVTEISDEEGTHEGAGGIVSAMAPCAVGPGLANVSL